MTTAERIGHQLEELRKLKGLTQREAAERLGMKPPQLAKIEKGANDTGIGLVDKIVTEYGGRIEIRV